MASNSLKVDKNNCIPGNQIVLYMYGLQGRRALYLQCDNLNVIYLLLVEPNDVNPLKGRDVNWLHLAIQV